MTANKHIKFTLKSILRLRILQQNLSPETVTICIAVLCFTHDNTLVARGPGSKKKVGYCVTRLRRRLRRPRRRLSNSVLVVVGGFSVGSGGAAGVK